MALVSSGKTRSEGISVVDKVLAVAYGFPDHRGGFKANLLFVDETIDADRYIQNPCEFNSINAVDVKFVPFRWIFRQAGTSSCTAMVAMEWPEGNVDVIVDWPANSPDLLPIKLLCAFLKQRI
jgi:hypothetical protein